MRFDEIVNQIRSYLDYALPPRLPAPTVGSGKQRRFALLAPEMPLQAMSMLGDPLAGLARAWPAMQNKLAGSCRMMAPHRNRRSGMSGIMKMSSRGDDALLLFCVDTGDY